MLKQLSARGSLFLFVRTHHHLEFYFNLSDIRLAANQQGAVRKPRSAKVIEIRGNARAGVQGPP